MAFFQVNFFSTTLCFNTDVNVIIPTPNSDEILNNKNSDYLNRESKFQVLYLLHGAYGDYSDWMRLTSIEKYAQEHKLAVVMPSASNSFYQNMYHGSDYLNYLTEELPQFIEKIFPVSIERKDTFIAGLSMGGYGAIKIAFERPDKFIACASLSGALDLCSLVEENNIGIIKGPFIWENIFEKPVKIEGSDADLYTLIKKRKNENCELPMIYQTVGTEDFIYKLNLKAKAKLEELEISLTYEEYPGIHDWNFWDTYIKRVLEWLPLANDTVGTRGIENGIDTK